MIELVQQFVFPTPCVLSCSSSSTHQLYVCSCPWFFPGLSLNSPETLLHVISPAVVLLHPLISGQLWDIHRFKFFCSLLRTLCVVPHSSCGQICISVSCIQLHRLYSFVFGHKNTNVCWWYSAGGDNAPLIVIHDRRFKLQSPKAGGAVTAENK